MAFGWWSTGAFGTAGQFTSPATQGPSDQDRNSGFETNNYNVLGSFQPRGAVLTSVFPATLFASGTAGAWYDPGDLSTMWQDSAKTTAAAVDQPVGYMVDKSGNGNDLSQATSAKRPILRQSGSAYYLEFDGTDDFMSVNAASLRIVGDLTVSAVTYKNSGGSWGCIAACQTNAGTINSFEFHFNTHASVADPELVDANGTTFEQIAAGGPNDVGTLAAWHVFSLRRTAHTNVELSCDGLRGPTAALTITPTSDASSVFTIGDRNGTGIPLAGRLGNIVVIASRLSDADLASLETYLTASTPPPSVIVALTGQSATVAKGSVSPQTDAALSGRSATVSGGTLTLTTSLALTGQALSVAQGALTPGTTEALTGQALAVAKGTVTVSSAAPLSGQALVVAGGSITASTTTGITGQSLSVAQQSLTATIAPDLVGQTLAVAKGSLAVSSTRSLTGAGVTVAGGSVSPLIAPTLTGKTLTVGRGTVTVPAPPSTGGSTVIFFLW